MIRKKLHKSALREPVEFFCDFSSVVALSQQPPFPKTYLQVPVRGDKMKEISFIKK
jgi:hypothetical protein